MSQVKRMGPLDLKPELKNFRERIKLERENRKDLSILPFGVKYLDESLNGIREDDFVLFGAPTGVGKTHLASAVAMHNSQLGKRVYYFALEAAENEIEKRIKYQIMSKVFYDSGANQSVPFELNFMDWNDGLIKHEVLDRAELDIEESFSKDFETLTVVYRGRSEYTVEHFAKQLTELQDLADLIVIDHLHYFDFDDQNENRAVKKIMKTISDMAQQYHIPVVMVAHLKKKDRGTAILIPSEDDFHGTSDIAKIPTKIVTIAPARNVDRNEQMITQRLWPTYMRIAKCRGDRSRCMYPGLLAFSNKTNSYQETYKIGQLNYQENEWTQLMGWDQFPSWAKNAARDYK